MGGVAMLLSCRSGPAAGLAAAGGSAGLPSWCVHLPGLCHMHDCCGTGKRYVRCMSQYRVTEASKSSTPDDNIAQAAAACQSYGVVMEHPSTGAMQLRHVQM
jgi:hypothetical protein